MSFDSDLLEARRIIAGRLLRARRVLETVDPDLNFIELLSEFDLTWTDVGLSSEKLNYDTWYDILSRLRRKSHLPGICLVVGSQSKVDELGILGYALISCSTLGRSWEAGVESKLLFGCSADITTSIVGENVHVAYEFRPPVRRDILAVMETEASSTLALIRELTSEMSFTFLEVRLSYRAPLYAQRYAEILRCPVKFDQEKCEIIYPKTWLNVPFPLANEETAAVCRERCRQIVRKLTRQTTIVNKVREILIHSSFRDGATLENVAKQLRMSPATLRRRFQDEDASFRRVVNEVRIEIAKEYLRETDLTLQQVTYLLGYGYPSTFHRAFQQQTGKTPLEYRTQVRGGADVSEAGMRKL